MEYVTSADGTRIAYDRGGSGPPLVLVHGSLNDRNVFGLVRAKFGKHRTVYAMDRRGRGESGPPAPHALEREFEDVLAVIDAAGAPADLLGHSYGAHVALGAAALAPEQVRRLVLYEPPTIDELRGDLGLDFADDPEQALANFVLHIGMTPDGREALRQTPFWTYMLSFAETMPHEARALIEKPFDAARFSVLTMPALFLVGSVTKEHLGEVMRQLERHMPDVTWHEFAGQGHGANLLAPDEFAEVVLRFLGAV